LQASAARGKTIQRCVSLSADLRADRDHWREAFERAQRAQPKPLSWWRWLRTTG